MSKGTTSKETVGTRSYGKKLFLWSNSPNFLDSNSYIQKGARNCSDLAKINMNVMSEIVSHRKGEFVVKMKDKTHKMKCRNIQIRDSVLFHSKEGVILGRRLSTAFETSCIATDNVVTLNDFKRCIFAF